MDPWIFIDRILGFLDEQLLSTQYLFRLGKPSLCDTLRQRMMDVSIRNSRDHS